MRQCGGSCRAHGPVRHQTPPEQNPARERGGHQTGASPHRSDQTERDGDVGGDIGAPGSAPGYFDQQAEAGRTLEQLVRARHGEVEPSLPGRCCTPIVAVARCTASSSRSSRVKPSSAPRRCCLSSRLSTAGRAALTPCAAEPPGTPAMARSSHRGAPSNRAGRVRGRGQGPLPNLRVDRK